MSSDLEVHGLLNDVNTTLWNNNLRILSPDQQEADSDWNILNNVTFVDVDSDGTIENLNISYLAKEIEERRNQKYQTESGIIVKLLFC